MKSKPRQPACAGPVRRGRGFTLVEILIAVAAVALLSVGISAIFSSAGETVRSGRRISTLNEYASLLERQMRQDFASMTREGFILIRNEYAARDDNPPNFIFGDEDYYVPLTVDQETRFARARRIDEIVFFTRGRYESARPPAHPDRVPVADAARIYYGHGRQRELDIDSGSEYVLPQLFDLNTDPDFALGRETTLNPNRFASGWTLLRHVTLLAPPSAAIRRPVQGFGVEQFDSDLQISMQPSASGIFRNQTFYEPTAYPPDFVRNDQQNAGNAAFGPKFSSGLVDIASTDLTEIRAIVLDSQDPADPNIFSPDGLVIDGRFDRGTQSLDFQQAWMREALPADSDRTARIRVERSAPDYFGDFSGGAQETYMRDDQRMLGAFSLVPRCTEFIVEWSFGQRDGQDNLVWYGLERRVDADGDGNLEPAEAVALPYDGFTFPYEPPAIMRDGQRRPDRENNRPGRVVPDELIHGGGIAPGQRVMYSYFGYIDPVYDRTAEFPDIPEADRPASLPWAWPRLIRVTMSLVDESEPLQEQTFQFVFAVPQPEPDAERY